MERWKIGLVGAVVLMVIVTPAVASARGFWCVGDPIVKINGITTKLIVSLEQDAQPVLRSEGQPVVITVTLPDGFDFQQVSQGQESFPIEVVPVTGRGSKVTVSVTAPDLAGYGEYAIQLTVEVPSRQWEDSSAPATGQAPHTKLAVPADLF